MVLPHKNRHTHETRNTHSSVQNGLDLNVKHDTTKFLEEIIGKTSSDIYCTNVFLGQGNRNKNKNKQMGPNQMYKLLHSKGNHNKK